jgi:hypothetical protein
LKFKWAKSPCAPVQEQCCTVLEVASPTHRTIQVVHAHGVTSNTYCMSIQPFYGKGPHPLLWVRSQGACTKIRVVYTNA